LDLQNNSSYKESSEFYLKFYHLLLSRLAERSAAKNVWQAGSIPVVVKLGVVWCSSYWPLVTMSTLQHRTYRDLIGKWLNW